MPRGPNEELEYELGPETEIDSAPSSLLQIPSNQRDEATKEGEQENDDTLIPDTNDLNDQTETAGEITYRLFGNEREFIDGHCRTISGHFFANY